MLELQRLDEAPIFFPDDPFFRELLSIRGITLDVEWDRVSFERKLRS